MLGKIYCYKRRSEYQCSKLHESHQTVITTQKTSPQQHCLNHLHWLSSPIPNSNIPYPRTMADKGILWSLPPVPPHPGFVSPCDCSDSICWILPFTLFGFWLLGLKDTYETWDWPYQPRVYSYIMYWVVLGKQLMYLAK